MLVRFWMMQLLSCVFMTYGLGLSLNFVSFLFLSHLTELPWSWFVSIAELASVCVVLLNSVFCISLCILCI